MADTMTSGALKLKHRVVRYGDLKPCFDAFIDTRTPGSDQKENFTIIGPGVSENPHQHVHIPEPHGFNIGGARQPPGCTNSQHSHDTAEVFYVHSGKWRFDLGEHGDDAQVILNPGDLISIPTQLFRGFQNIGDDTGFLWAVLGGDDPGRVLWAPKVFELAKEYGLVLLDDGMLIDNNKGESIPVGKQPMPVTTAEQISQLQVFDDGKLEACVARSDASGPRGNFDHLDGVSETYLIGSGRMDWSHGFCLSTLRMEPGSMIPEHRIDQPDVWFVQSGSVAVDVDGDAITLSAGDTITVPRGAVRQISNISDSTIELIAVRGGDTTPETHWS
ncbi:MAG: cupin domain-containing protein [Pseudomonadota bacterium]